MEKERLNILKNCHAVRLLQFLYLTCANIGNGQLYMSVSNGSETIMTKTSMNNTLRSKGISDTIKAFVLGIGNVQNIQAIPRYLFG